MDPRYQAGASPYNRGAYAPPHPHGQDYSDDEAPLYAVPRPFQGQNASDNHRDSMASDYSSASSLARNRAQAAAAATTSPRNMAQGGPTGPLPAPYSSSYRSQERYIPSMISSTPSPGPNSAFPDGLYTRGPASGPTQPHRPQPHLVQSGLRQETAGTLASSATLFHGPSISGPGPRSPHHHPSPIMGQRRGYGASGPMDQVGTMHHGSGSPYYGSDAKSETGDSFEARDYLQKTRGSPSTPSPHPAPKGAMGAPFTVPVGGYPMPSSPPGAPPISSLPFGQGSTRGPMNFPPNNSTLQSGSPSHIEGPSGPSAPSPLPSQPSAEKKNESEPDVWDFPKGAKPSETKPHSHHIDPSTLPLEKAKRKKTWWRRYLCCCCCCSGKVITMIVFGIGVALGLVGFFFWPRAPQIFMYNPVSSADQVSFSTPSRTMLDFAADMEITAELKSANFIPWHFTKVEAEVFDGTPGSGFPLGSGILKDYNMPRGLSNLTVPMYLTYSTGNASDPTFNHLVTACSTNHPSMPIRIKLTIHVILLSNLGMKPSVDRNYNWDCPKEVTAKIPET